MKKILFAIFAHPDDEAFGPSGTLLKLKHEGYDIHLILLTNGEGGTNPDGVADLGAVRLKEWQTAAKILGAGSTHALGYPDGTLEKVPTDELDTVTHKLISTALENHTEPVEVSFMTFEPNGLTGHRDHIAASELATRMAVTFNVKKIWYFCLDSTQAPLDGTAYYEPRAREDSYITTRVDVSDYSEDKDRMMEAHHSQRQDAAKMKNLDLSTESFHVETY